MTEMRLPVEGAEAIDAAGTLPGTADVAVETDGTGTAGSVSTNRAWRGGGRDGWGNGVVMFLPSLPQEKTRCGENNERDESLRVHE